MLRFTFGTMSPTYEVTPFFALCIMILCLGCDIKVNLLELPLFVPNEYMYRTHYDKISKPSTNSSPEPKHSSIDIEARNGPHSLRDGKFLLGVSVKLCPKLVAQSRMMLLFAIRFITRSFLDTKKSRKPKRLTKTSIPK